MESDWNLSDKKRKPHTEERKKKISEALKGRKFTAEHRKNCSLAKQKEKHPKWKGENTAKITKHIYVARYKPKPVACEWCNSDRKLALANMKDHNYTKNLEDYRWLCYSCHTKYDMGLLPKLAGEKLC